MSDDTFVVQSVTGVDLTLTIAGPGTRRATRSVSGSRSDGPVR